MDLVRMTSLEQVGRCVNMTGVLISRRHVKTEIDIENAMWRLKTETRVMQQKPRKTRDCQQTTRSWGRRMEQIFLHSPQKEPSLLSP